MVAGAVLSALTASLTTAVWITGSALGCDLIFVAYASCKRVLLVLASSDRENVKTGDLSGALDGRLNVLENPS